MRSEEMLDTLSVGVIFLAADAGKFRICNSSAKSHLSFLGADCSLDTWISLEKLQGLPSDLESAESHIAECRFEHDDGTSAFLRFRECGVSEESFGCQGRWVLVEDLAVTEMLARTERESRERLELAERSANFGIFEYRVSDGVVEFDGALAELLGFSDGSPIPLDKFMNALIVEDRASAYDALAKLLNGRHGDTAYHECRFTDPRSAQAHWVNMAGHLTLDNGQMLVTGVFQDVTERKALDAAKRASNEFLSSILSHGNVIAWAKDENHRYTFLSENCAKRWHLGTSDWLGKREADIWEAGTANTVSSISEGVLRTGEDANYQIEIRDLNGGTSHWLARQFLLRDAEGTTLVGGFATEITDVLESERERETSEIRLRAFLNNPNFVAFAKDRHGKYVFMSEPFKARFLDPTVEGTKEVVSADIWDTVSVMEMEEENTRVLQHGESIETLREQKTKDGKTSWWLKQKFPIHDANGERYIGCVALDVTERTELHAARAELRALLETLQGTIEQERLKFAREVHDLISSPLSAVKALLHLLDDDRPKFLTTKKYIIPQLLEIVSHLLEDADSMVSWLRPPEIDHLGMQAAISALVADFAALHSIECHVDVWSEVPRMQADTEIAVYRITQECLANVAKHANAKSAVVALGVAGGELELRVDDDGEGFKDRTTTARRGYGLIGCRERATALGGMFTARSRQQGGASAVLTVPIQAK